MNIISIYTKEDFIKKDDKIIILEICEESSDKVEREEVEGDHIRIEYDSVNSCTITQIYYDKSKEKIMKNIYTCADSGREDWEYDPYRLEGEDRYELKKEKDITLAIVNLVLKSIDYPDSVSIDLVKSVCSKYNFDYNTLVTICKNEDVTNLLLSKFRPYYTQDSNKEFDIKVIHDDEIPF